MSNSSAAQAQATEDIRLPGENLTIEETLRVMDVAREMRDQRETAEELFRREDVRSRLREKLMQTALVSGDNVTEAEINAAIDQYLETVNRYADPEPGLRNFLAHCWIWRGRIIASLAAVAVAASGFWFLFT
jgi:hypothetical protein